MADYKEFDGVVLLQDMPEEGLKKGMIGTVVLCFDTPEIAYEVEFCDENGEAIAELALRPEQIAPAIQN
jgi:hypothetical protein